MYQVIARIEGLETDGVGCFDPTAVVYRLMEELPEAIVCLHDYAWRDYETFSQMGAEGAMRVAESDALRRGPIYLFRLRTGTQQEIKGVAERYRVRITSEQEIPADLRKRFLAFLGALRFDPIEVKSVRIEGNDEPPA